MSDDTPTVPSPPEPKPEPRTRLAAIVVAVTAVVLLGIGGIAAVARGNSNASDSEWHGTVQEPATPRPEFTLTDTEGQPYDFAEETQGRLTLLFFGYTNCPDVCPGHMAILSGALAMPGMPEPIVVFVTTDPERDTPERLRSWLDDFDESFVGLTGTVDEIAAAERASYVAGSVRATSEDGEYEVGHAAQILAYSPDDQAHLVYPFGTRREDWAADLPRLLEEYPAASQDDEADR